MSAFDTPGRDASERFPTGEGVQQLTPFSLQGTPVPDTTEKIIDNTPGGYHLDTLGMVGVVGTHGIEVDLGDPIKVPDGFTLNIMHETILGHIGWLIEGSLQHFQDAINDAKGLNALETMRYLQHAMLINKTQLIKEGLVHPKWKTLMSPGYTQNFACDFQGNVSTYPEMYLQRDKRFYTLLPISVDENIEGGVEVGKNFFDRIEKNPRGDPNVIKFSNIVKFLHERGYKCATLICLFCRIVGNPDDLSEIEAQYKSEVQFSPDIKSKIMFNEAVSPLLKEAARRAAEAKAAAEAAEAAAKEAEEARKKAEAENKARLEAEAAAEAAEAKKKSEAELTELLKQIAEAKTDEIATRMRTLHKEKQAAEIENKKAREEKLQQDIEKGISKIRTQVKAKKEAAILARKDAEEAEKEEQKQNDIAIMEIMASYGSKPRTFDRSESRTFDVSGPPITQLFEEEAEAAATKRSAEKGAAEGSAGGKRKRRTLKKRYTKKHKRYSRKRKTRLRKKR